MATEFALHVPRDTTVEAHRQAVERVIREVRCTFNEPLALADMARLAHLSPAYFDRIFRQITGIPPVQFLYALRIEAAKRLLLTTSLSVIDVCYEVGYNSIGTFTSRFTHLVGVSPRQFRYLAKTLQDEFLESLISQALNSIKPAPADPFTTGQIVAPHPLESLIFVGLFPTLIPQSRPLAGTLLKSAGSYYIAPLRRNHSYVFAATFPGVRDHLSYFLPNPASLLVGVGTRPVTANHGNRRESVDVSLRTVQITDPPLLLALPLILMEAVSRNQ